MYSGKTWWCSLCGELFHCFGCYQKHRDETHPNAWKRAPGPGRPTTGDDE